LKQQVATLEEKCLVEKMVTHKLRNVLVEISTSAEIVAKQLSIAVPESECALRNAHQLAEHTDKLSEELKTCNSQIKHAQEKAAVAHQQLADAQAAIAAHSINVMDLKTELSAATVVSDDLQAQLIKALAAKCALSGDFHNTTCSRVWLDSFTFFSEDLIPLSRRLTQVL
jgi:uncharacterized protein (DUF3084 family)